MKTTLIFGALILVSALTYAGGKGVIVVPVPPIEIPDDKPNCGCPCPKG